MTTLLLPLPPVKSSSANVHRLGYIGRMPLSEVRDSDSWFTPPEYIQTVREVMGGIDLDPFSSEMANKIVQAKHFFTEDLSAFDHSWKVAPNATVFMNPPYSASLIAQAVNRFVHQWQDKAFTQAIVLVNNATDTRWFSILARYSQAICFTDHRISFWNADGKKVSGNTRGQAFFYYGKKVKQFQRKFSSHGIVVEPLK